MGLLLARLKPKYFRIKQLQIEKISIIGSASIEHVFCLQNEKITLQLKVSRKGRKIKKISPCCQSGPIQTL